MSRATQGLIVLLLGGVFVGITLNGRYTSYVKPGFAPLLLIAGVILLAMGALTLLGIRGRRSDEHQHHDDEPDAHGHSHGQLRSGWLILAPILVIVLVAPGPLGASTVVSQAGSQAVEGLDAAPAVEQRNQGYAPNDGKRKTSTGSGGRRTMQFPALPAGADPVITIKEFVLRSLYDAEPTIVDRSVTIVGFIAPAGKGYSDGYTVARLAISCCAADANPVRVHVAGVPPFPVNTWVEVVATAVPGSAGRDNEYVPIATATSVKQVEQPSDPYEH